MQFLNRFRQPSPAQPTLTLAQRVVDKIVANALIYQTETGEALIGFALPAAGRPEPDLYVLDTIAPDETAIRQEVYFEQGDAYQGAVFNWLHDNWKRMRASMRVISADNAAPKWDAPLLHLGDWHKHPGTLVEPSWGDTNTARRRLRDQEVDNPQILAILATVWDRAWAEGSAPDVPNLAAEGTSTGEDFSDAPDEFRPEGGTAQPLKIPVDDSTLVRIDCWYMSRLTRRFVRVTPVVVPNNQLPKLPPIGWHLADPDRLAAEVAALKAAGYSTTVEEFDADRVPPKEVCIMLARQTSRNVLILITEADYPHNMPQIRYTPLTAMRGMPESANVFDWVWNASQPLPQAMYPIWSWTPQRHLIELAQEVEARLDEGKVTP
jgi:hypothetical protein